MQLQNQFTKQEQMQWNYMSRGLNALIASLNRLDSTNGNLPSSLEEASKASKEVIKEVDNCIFQVLASTKEVNHTETFDSIKKRVATRMLQWLSIREKEVDVIDELTALLLYNCVGRKKEIPNSIETWDGKLSEEELQDFSQAIVNSQYDLEKDIKEHDLERSPMLNEIQKIQNVDYQQGIKRIELFDKELSKILLAMLSNN